MIKKRNVLLEKLYEMAESKDENGLSKFDEEKLKRELAADKDLFKPNKKSFEEKEENFTTCKRYNPCPICDKCKNKASHLYVKCQTCIIPICVHDHKTITKMILRKNFLVKVQNEEFKEAFKKLK